MSSKLIEFNLPGTGFRKGFQLYNIVRVQFLESRFTAEFDAQQLFLAPNEIVILEEERGPVPAKIVSYPFREMRKIGTLRRVLRLATEQDQRQMTQNKYSEAEGYKFALQRIRAHKLPMKLVRVQWIHDGSRAVFFYSSPNRVDFRTLVKELAQKFHTRIELHQIGVRDGTSMVGGIGSCGRELCCSTFLKHFATVSITLAKDQGITLAPHKISGQCGRLMCCLVYEHRVYMRNRRRLPQIGDWVEVREGEAEILSIDILHRRLLLRVQDTGQRMTRGIDEVILLSGNAPVNPPERISETEYIWDKKEMVTLID